ncbi:type VII secretion target [Streptomyces sp. G-G2]|uniref:WXG100 family type VII secretion target n=1 Tax=Streptomyces sp. G-G2 TaxID=3046201 RepID=UPI0024BB9650|nr:type VII secretion target [Streptomyces sp. G-G2]MDJ0382496.1 type VII secretion target [Streptomyces sp. G-G2]
MSDDLLPEPERLPLTPDELSKRNLGPFAPFYQAPAADSYADPTTPRDLQPGPSFSQPQSPFLRPPVSPTGPGPGGQRLGQRLKIAPSILNTAADRADEIHTAFTKPAAALEAPARTASTTMAGWESAYAIQAAHRQWEQQAGTVAGWLAHIAESLRAGARDYDKTDAAIEDAFRGVRVRRSLIEDL